MNALSPIPSETLPVIPAGYRRRGFVYAIRDDAAQAVKIGFTRNPERRLRQLQTANATPLRTLCVFENVQAFEASLHQSFASRRMSGEWFNDADKSLSEIFGLIASGEA